MGKKISLVKEDLESKSELERGKDKAQENVSFNGIFFPPVNTATPNL